MMVPSMKLLVVVVYTLLSLAYNASSSFSSSPSVIIVGAGMSGISAAKTLHDAGIRDFVILEATNRIGGRIKKTEFGGEVVEMGANWLHGVGGPLKNPLYEMSKKIHLKTFLSDYNNISFNTYKQDGGMYNPTEVDAAFGKVEETKKFGANFTKILDAHKDDDMSILDLERLHKTDPKTPLEKMADFFGFDGEQAEAPRVTNLKHVVPFPEAHDYGENSYFVADPRGFESLVHLYAKTFLSYKDGYVNDSRVKFNQVVREITQSKKGVTIRTEDGEQYQAKTVIVSASLGVLQSELISFKPELPLWKRRAISEFSIGIYTKIFLKFPSTFWPTGNGTEFFSYVHERRGYYAIWQHLEHEHPGSNMMFVTVTDDESVRVEQQSNEETKAEAMEVLREMFGDNIPEPTDIMIPRWKSDRFYQGCFTNWPVGYPQKRHNQLRAPVGRIYFTGEHTHPRLFGYADGAFYAGANTAKVLIRKLIHTYNVDVPKQYTIDNEMTRVQ